MFSGGVKRDQWHEMSLNKRANVRTRGTKKTKHAKYARICAYQEVNVHFSENSACFVFLLSPSWDSSFCLKTDKLNVPKQRYFCHRCVCVCVFVLYPLLFIHPLEGIERGLQSLNLKLIKLILHTGSPSYHLNSPWKSALI